MKHYIGVREMYILSKIYKHHNLKCRNLYSILFLANFMLLILFTSHLLNITFSGAINGLEIVETVSMLFLFKSLYVIRKTMVKTLD